MKNPGYDWEDTKHRQEEWTSGVSEGGGYAEHWMCTVAIDGPRKGARGR